MNILLIGAGGREHAIARKLAESPLCTNVFVAPGNGGSGDKISNVTVNSTDAVAVLSFCNENSIDMVCIGPEVPLVAGLADELRAHNISTFGPGKAGARLEGSKAFSKEFMMRHHIPTAKYGVFDDEASALDYLTEIGVPIVVKADGLAAGKGVSVCFTVNDAKQAIHECFGGRFGAAGKTVLLEECLVGVECSLLAFVAGGKMLPLAPAKDHKRVGDGDTGPNTGGMGVFSPVPFVSDVQLDEMLQVMQASVDGLGADGIDFRGILYGGFMLTDSGVKVLEYNTRFGDPETQVLLPRLQSDLVEIMLAVAKGNLAGVKLDFSEQKAVSVVLAAAGYPGDYATGKAIKGIEQAEQLAGVTVYHAGTKLVNNDVCTAGGRVLNVTAVRPSFAEARDTAYAACGLIEFEGKFCRSDIAASL